MSRLNNANLKELLEQLWYVIYWTDFFIRGEIVNNTNILITTTENIPGKQYEIIGEVFGLTTQSKNVVKNIGAGLKNIVGGEIKAYTELLTEARDIAIERLQENAVKMGADAVVMMRFDSDSISQDMETVAAYGTAVKFK